MKYLDFEKHIKKELGGSKETVQMDALLTSLNLGKEPKRKGFAYWMILPFLILTFSVFAWKFMGFYNNNASDSILSKEASSIKNTGSEAYNINTTSTQDENAIGLQYNVLHEAKLNKTKSENTKISANSTTNINSEKIQLTKSSATIDNKPPAKSDSPMNALQYSNQPESNNDQVNLKSSYIQPRASNTSLSQDNQSNPTGIPDSKLSRRILSIAGLNKSINAVENHKIDGNLFSRMKINCPSFDNAGWHLALIPEVGVFLPKKTLENNSSEESAAFTERLNSESTLEGIQLGLYGMLVRDNFPFYLKVGASYSRISERMDLQYEYTKQDTTIGIISTTVSNNGDTITHIYGDIITETTFKGSNRQHYYIHLFDVPVSIGYSTYFGGFDIGIEGGVKVNFMTRATGNLLTSERDYTNLSLNRLFKNRIGLSYFGGLMIGRNFGRFGDFYIAPRFNYYPNEFNNQNNSIGQKYFSIGLNAGVIYKIN